MTIENLTDSSRVDNPLEGDKIRKTYDKGLVVVDTYHTPHVKTQEEIENAARAWRDSELFKVDYIVPLTDHPQHSEYMAYRVVLRDWPSTSNFPATKPTL